MSGTLDGEITVHNTKKEALDVVRLDDPERGVLSELRRVGHADAHPSRSGNLYYYALYDCHCTHPWAHECEDIEDIKLVKWLEWMSKGDKLEVVDSCNAYYLYRGNESACMGDGVDTEFAHPITGRPVTVGQSLFTAIWQREINDSPGGYVEAYFGGTDES